MLLILFVLAFFMLGVGGGLLAIVGVGIAARREKNKQRDHELEMARLRGGA